jgi:two-component system nitrogen regulation sensor histidine kinase NtrY
MTRVRRIAGWSAVAVVLFFVLLSGWRAGARLAESAPQYAANRLVLAFLTLAIVFLSLAFAGVLVRNLVRLILDRKRGMLGSRLRTKMVFFFLAFLLLPAFILSYGAASFMKASVDTLLRTPVEDVVSQAGQIVKEAGRREESRAKAVATEAARALLGDPGRGGDRATSPDLLASFARGHAVDLVVLRWADGGALSGGPASEDPERVAAARSSAEEMAAEVRLSGRTAFRVREVPGGYMLEAGSPWPPGVPDGASADAAAVVSTFVTREAATRMDAVNRAQEAFARFRAERRELLRFYYVLISLVGLATVFAATWIGFTVARRITDPIQELAAATKEISGGNLNVRVNAATGDEVGLLVDAFNEMAAQLQESREVITRSTAELRRSNQAIEERRRTIETLIANLSTGIVSVDPAGRITASNPVAERILGRALPSGAPFSLTTLEEPYDALSQALREILAPPVESRRRDLEFSRDGTSMALSIQVAALQGARGESLGILLMLEDLTELLRAQKAAAWQEVARRLAHEIKNPLTPIQLSAQRMRRKFDDGADDLPEVVRSSTASIEAEVANLKRLVDEFSRYARLPEPILQDVDVAEIVNSVRSLYAGHGEITWTAETDPGLGRVRVDPEQIRRVLTNLIDNAVEATGGKGHLAVRLGRMAARGSLRLEVEDDGPGVPAEQRMRMFEPYFSTKRRGTGLGLAIVQRIVSEHRGTIRVEDGAAGGLRFVVELPGDDARDRG